jgi:hypothetical protein
MAESKNLTKSEPKQNIANTSVQNVSSSQGISFINTPEEEKDEANIKLIPPELIWLAYA